jgi:hypothetical protein
MEPAVVSALSAVLGSVVGGSASIASAWFTQHSQGRREVVRAEVSKRESLYADFIAECSRLVADALGHSLEQADILVKVYSLENRIRLVASEAVVEAAAHAIRRILELYFEPNVSKADLRTLTNGMKPDALKEFSAACRRELADLQRGT